MRGSIILIFVTGLLFACASPAERSAKLDGYANQLIQTYGPTCEMQGYATNSAPWRNCVYQSGKQELSKSDGTEWNFPLIHRLGQRVGLINAG